MDEPDLARTDGEGVDLGARGPVNVRGEGEQEGQEPRGEPVPWLAHWGSGKVRPGVEAPRLEGLESLSPGSRRDAASDGFIQ